MRPRSRRRVPPRRPSALLGRLMARLPGGGFEAPPVAATFTDGQVLAIAGGLRVVRTPRALAPGHVSLLHEPTGLLITGDAIFNVRGLRWPVRVLHQLRADHPDGAAAGELDAAGGLHARPGDPRPAPRRDPALPEGPPAGGLRPRPAGHVRGGAPTSW